MARKRPKLEPIRNPTLFQMEKLEEAVKLANSLRVERPYSEPGLYLGTSSFTAAGWEGSFYPKGMQSRDFLSYYATQFATVEVDSTFYGCSSARTVNNWADRTPEDFIFSVKVPQIISHEKALVGCDSEIAIPVPASSSPLPRMSLRISGRWAPKATRIPISRDLCPTM